MPKFVFQIIDSNCRPVPVLLDDSGDNVVVLLKKESVVVGPLLIGAAI